MTAVRSEPERYEAEGSNGCPHGFGDEDLALSAGPAEHASELATAEPASPVPVHPGALAYAVGEPLLATHGWTRDSGQTLWQAVERFRPAGLRHVLCTDVDRDGTMGGPNVPLYAELSARYPELEVQASGGVRGLDDLAALRDAGCAAAITGRALLDAALSPAEVVSFQRGA